MKMKKEQLKVCGTVYLASHVRYKSSNTYTVMSIKRKYAEVGFESSLFPNEFTCVELISLDDMCVKDKYTGNALFSVYESHQAYVDHTTLVDEWREFTRKVQHMYHPPADMTLDKIKQLSELMNNFGE